MNFLILYVFIIYQISHLYTIDVPVKIGHFNDTIMVNVSKMNGIIIVYSYNQSKNDRDYLRAYVMAVLDSKHSALIVLKDDDNLVNYMRLSNSFEKSNVSAERTICPSSYLMLPEVDRQKTLTVEISTQSLLNITVTLEIRYMTNFQLKLNEPISLKIGLMSPVYFAYQFTKDIDHVNVIVDSDDDTCMIFSIQEAGCPVYDRPENVKFQGTYQTVTKSGSITIRNSTFPNSKVFVVFVLATNSYQCNRTLIRIFTQGKSQWANKSINVTIAKVPNKREYLLPTLSVIAFYAVFFIASGFISMIYNKYFHSPIPIEIEVPLDPIVSATLMSETVSISTDELADMETIYSRANRKGYTTSHDKHRLSGATSPGEELMSDEDSFDQVPEVLTNPDIYRLNKSLFVTDLSRKRSDVLNRKYFLYFWYLVIISVFYGLPVIQLLIFYQTSVRATGNEDMCYYNFKCTRPLFIFTAFNNLFSNIGYVLLGILFTMITWRRHRLYNEKKSEEEHTKKRGIPQYYGLFYAMGLALIMEGVMSACYHICPSNNNFQFDTAYMYILSCLCTIKLYQIRHPDIDASAHSFFMSIALFIFIGVMGVVYNHLAFWIIFTIIYIGVFIFLTAEIYYMGRWRLDCGLPGRIYVLLLNDRWMVFQPTYKMRILVLSMLNIINFSFALYGGITLDSNFATFFLTIFMINLFLYFFFYIAMKVKYREPFHVLNIIYIAIAVICWGFALYCFINHPTEWEKSPAQSRVENRYCILMDFYDIHDVWHMLSAMSLFFSFLALQNLDDGLYLVDRNKIAVF